MSNLVVLAVIREAEKVAVRKPLKPAGVLAESAERMRPRRHAARARPGSQSALGALGGKLFADAFREAAPRGGSP